MDDEAIAGVLGLESAYGYHVEAGPRLPFTLPARERPVAPWYPCIDVNQSYTGCLGQACPLEVCWTGGPSISYAAALRHRFHPTDAEYAPGARCLRCRHVGETTIAAIDARRGLIHLPMLQCERQHWLHPISTAAFVRRRIPTDDDTDLARCADFEPANEPIPAVEQRRLQVNQRARDRRAARIRQTEREIG
jgi:hypothetical protein